MGFYLQQLELLGVCGEMSNEALLVPLTFGLGKRQVGGQ